MLKHIPCQRHPSSFRDRDGYLFTESGVLYRRLHPSYEPHYQRLMGSGLYDELMSRGLLVSHEDCSDSFEPDHREGRVIRPAHLPFISYPYEWSFDQLKDAALLTLDIQKRALAHDMTLKDGSAYNVQFHGGRPVFIDTLSFDTYRPGSSWVAYNQFCRHFLAPLAVMSSQGSDHGRLLRSDLEGMSLELASAVLPFFSRLNFHLFLHLHAHAGSVRAAKRGAGSSAIAPMSKAALMRLIDSLESAVRTLRPKKPSPAWTEYYNCGHTYSESGLREKEAIVSGFLDRILFSKVWDVGANTGRFSRLCADRQALTLALDYDPDCVNDLYLRLRSEKNDRLFPLLHDAADPSPAMGWALAERSALVDRCRPDLILALALTHHLVIGRNLTWDRIAGHWSRLAPHLIIEFVPKSDPQVGRLLASRRDIFHDYSPESFQAAFSEHYIAETSQTIASNGRTLLLMRSRHEKV